AETELRAGRAQSCPDDLVLAEEAREEWEAADGEGADQEGPEGDREAGPQIAHVTDVLVIVEGVNHVAGGHEEERLEKRVGHEMEHAGGVGTDAHRQDHVADLK